MRILSLMYNYILEVNCINNLSPNHTSQPTNYPQNICEQVTTTSFQKYDAFVVILSQMFSGCYDYLQDNGDTCVTSFKDA